MKVSFKKSSWDEYTQSLQNSKSWYVNHNWSHAILQPSFKKFRAMNNCNANTCVQNCFIFKILICQIRIFATKKHKGLKKKNIGAKNLILAHGFETHTRPFGECVLIKLRYHHLVLQPEKQVKLQRKFLHNLKLPISDVVHLQSNFLRRKKTKSAEFFSAKKYHLVSPGFLRTHWTNISNRLRNKAVLKKFSGRCGKFC